MAIGHMNISQRGIDFIKSHEGFREQSYKCLVTEKYFTIGYGHYGPDVRLGQVITQAQGEALLKQDLERFVAAVNRYDYHYDFNQNEFDALVSFTYNLGEGCLCQLTDNKRRSKAEIAEKMLLYCNSGGNRIPGLVQRRKDEKAYFLSGAASPTPEPKYQLAVPTLRRRCKGDKVKVLQKNLNDFFGAGLSIDGDFGAKTKAAVEFMQDALGITIDGIYGPKSCEALTKLAKERGYNI